MDKIRVSRGLPQRYPDTSPVDARGGAYGEVMVGNLYGDKHFLADEGSYFVATNPTPYTPIALTTSIVTFAETAGAVGVAMLLKNLEARSERAKRLYLDYIKLMVVGTFTTGTSLQYAMVIDDNPIRWTSGGSAITPVNPNGDVGIASIAQLYFGALTTAVPNNKRLVARGTLRGVIPTTFDEFTIVSGGAVSGGTGFASAAASGKSGDHCPPIILGPQQNLALTLWSAACNAAATLEFEVGWWER